MRSIFRRATSGWRLFHGRTVAFEQMLGNLLVVRETPDSDYKTNLEQLLRRITGARRNPRSGHRLEYRRQFRVDSKTAHTEEQRCDATLLPNPVYPPRAQVT